MASQAEKTEEQIERERAAVEAMRNAKANMTAKQAPEGVGGSGMPAFVGLPSRKLSALAAFGAWSLTTFCAVTLKHFTGATDKLVDLLSYVGVGLAFVTYWEIRWAPVERFARAIAEHGQ